MSIFKFTPFDTLFFGDGSSFNQMDAGLSAVASRFPPLPSTLAGAALTVLWDHNIDEEYKKGLSWKEIADNLEDSKKAKFLRRLSRLVNADANEIKTPPLKLGGPFLFKDNNLYFPVPYTLHRSIASKRNDKTYWASLMPKKIKNDVSGSLTYLPFLQNENTTEKRSYKPLPSAWLRADLYKEYLLNPLGELFTGDKEDVGKSQKLEQAIIYDTHIKQEHVGIAINPQTGVVEEGQLYAASHIRFNEKNSDISIVASLQGQLKKKDIKSELKENDIVIPKSGVVSLGGEGRPVFFNTTNNKPEEKIKIKEAPLWNNNKIQYRLVALTPMPCGDGPFGLPKSENLPAPYTGSEVVCAVCPRPETVGLWHAQIKTMKLIKVFPAGSTWFLTCSKKENEKSLFNKELENRLGPEELTWMGYGMFAVGKWA